MKDSVNSINAQGYSHHSDTFNCCRSFEPYNCPKCPNFSTHFSIHLKQHKADQTLLNFQLYKCKNCLFKTYSKYLIIRHLKVANCSAPLIETVHHDHSYSKLDTSWLKCAFCRYRTKYKIQLKQHYDKKHTALVQKKEVTYLGCDECSFVTEFKKCLEVHKLWKHAKLWLKCGQCEFKAKGQRDLQTHVERDHKLVTKRVKWFKCGVCGYVTKIECELDVHLTKVHNREAVCFQCEFCLYRTLDESELIMHYKMRHGEMLIEKIMINN